MKKILGISLVAVLAVSPMMAGAAVDRPTGVNSAADITSTDAGTVATAAYVKGAYINLADAIDAEEEARTNAVKDVTDEIGNTQYSGGTLTGAIAALQGEISNEQTGLNARITANTNAISTLNGDANTAGSVAKSIQDKVETLDANLSQTANAGEGGNGGLSLTLTEVNGVVTGITGSIAAGTYDAAGAAATAQTAAINAAAADATTKANAAQAAAEATAAADATSKANAAQAAAEGTAKNYTDAAINGLATNYATKAQVTANINDATASVTLAAGSGLAVSGSVPAMTSWDSQTTGNVSLNSGAEATGTISNINVVAPTYVEDQPNT